MLREIKEVIWLSKMPISKGKENNIRECFVDEKMDFKYSNSVDQFDDLLEHLALKII